MYRIILYSLLSLLCLAFFILPYAEVFDPVTESWQQVYVYQVPLLLFVYLPFVLLWFLWLLLRGLFKKVLGYVLFLPALLAFFYAAASLLFTVQDLIPGPGMYIAIAWLPFYMAAVYTAFKARKNNARSTYDS